MVSATDLRGRKGVLIYRDQASAECLAKSKAIFKLTKIGDKADLAVFIDDLEAREITHVIIDISAGETGEFISIPDFRGFLSSL